jgi:hypothetical protein
MISSDFLVNDATLLASLPQKSYELISFFDFSEDE